MISSISSFSIPSEMQYFKWLSKITCPALCKAGFFYFNTITNNVYYNDEIIDYEEIYIKNLDSHFE